MTQFSIIKPSAGVLPIPVSATQKASVSLGKKSTHRSPATRLKLLVRRLPPGLTQAEFETLLGEEWRAGSGKVDWFQYKNGKISKDPAKPSRPARAYLRLTLEEHIAPLSEKLRASSFQDARNTGTDSVLLGPPSLEFAPYIQVPSSRIRKDGRQGTIDQDPEFIDFLESLTSPITKPGLVDPGVDGEKEDEVITTPLVQYIKEKKANKIKESVSPSKLTKHTKSDKEGKPEKVTAKKLLKRPASPSLDRKSVERATREAVEVANKQAASIAAKVTRPASPSVSKAAPPAAPPAAPSSGDLPVPTAERKGRGDISVAAKIVRQHLGLVPSGSRRRTRAENPSSKTADQSLPVKTPKEATTQDSTGGKDLNGAPPETVPMNPEWPTDQGWPTDPGWSTDPWPADPGWTTNPWEDPPSAPSAPSAPPATMNPWEDPPSAPSAPSAPPATIPPSNPAAKSPKPARSKPTVTPTATQAFLKHANPSQGVTEALLESAFAVFGPVLKVEMDKKKGFGYIDFADPDGLQKAIAASPVAIAQSQVVVLERRNPATTQRTRPRDDQQPPPSQPSPSQQQQTPSHRGGRPGGKSGKHVGGASQRGTRGGRNRGSPPKGGGEHNAITTGEESTIVPESYW
ncbi:hypothetical protein Egran_02378 [Elaphomyces granulatus]|uniref:RRM domain-containing protein n=1 Tax=Elaphomyces granulatus TaxID=519963 RepID=A0A232M178_9EURO|nr:hypothetical protein Egran_02378 [Elaphomyces granulatus]